MYVITNLISATVRDKSVVLCFPEVEKERERQIRDALIVVEHARAHTAKVLINSPNETLIGRGMSLLIRGSRYTVIVNSTFSRINFTFAPDKPARNNGTLDSL